MLFAVVNVSIPHRYAENFPHLLPNFNKPVVSIPHRYAENQLLPPPALPHDGVSIPHRYAENPKRLYNQWFDKKGFQSLIGMLKTGPAIRAANPPDDVSIPHRYAENEKFKPWRAKSEDVSIPHRYAEN